jgi:hypothetical protein
MITANFTAAISHISNLDNVRRVSVSDDGSRVAVCVGVYYDNNRSGDLRACSEALFVDIDERLLPFGFIHMDSEVDESDAGDCDAIEVWIFVRA